MKTEIYYCDVCSKEKDIKSINIDVVFLTDQTEGRYCEPYLSREKIDICEDCMIIVLSGKYIFGTGAQGYNKYSFKK